MTPPSGRSALSLYLLLFGVCLALGILTALLPRQPPNPPPALLPTATAGPVPGQETPQHTFLILGVDRLDSPSPQLRAIWLATFRPPGRDLFLLGLPPSYRPPGPGSSSLQEIFGWTPGRGPSEEFLLALQLPAPVAVDVVLALDEVAFAGVIDYAGGVDLNGVPLGGEQSVAVLQLLADDASASLSTQERLLEALALQAGRLGTTPDLTPLIAFIPSHAYLSVPASQAIALAAPLLPIEPSSIHVDLLVTP